MQEHERQREFIRQVSTVNGPYWVEDIGPGVRRYHYAHGMTDICVANEAHGVMDFVPTMGSSWLNDDKKKH